MIKNFLASAVGLRKETVPVSVNYAVEEDGKKILKAGTLVPIYTEMVGANPKYAVLFNDTDVTDKTEGTVSVGGVTAGHILSNVIIEAEQPNEEDLIAQGLYMEIYKEAQYPDDEVGEMTPYEVEAIEGEIGGGESGGGEEEEGE